MSTQAPAAERPATFREVLSNTEYRAVYFAESGDYVDCPIYDRYRLGRGARVAGPAVVEELDSTVVVNPGYVAEVDRYGNLVIRRA